MIDNPGIAVYRYSYDEPCDFYARNVQLLEGGHYRYDLVTPSGAFEGWGRPVAGDSEQLFFGVGRCRSGSRFGRLGGRLGGRIPCLRRGENGAGAGVRRLVTGEPWSATEGQGDAPDRRDRTQGYRSTLGLWRTSMSSS